MVAAIRFIPFLFTIGIAIMIPTGNRWISPMIGGWIVSCILFGNWRGYMNNFKALFPYAFPLAFLYGFYVIGLLWTDDMNAGLKVLEQKMTFAIFPLLFPLVRLDKKRVDWLMLVFVLTNLIVVGFNMHNWMHEYLTMGRVLKGSQHTPIMHRSFYSFYLVVSLLFLWLTPNLPWKFNTIWFKSVISFLFGVSIFIASSKMGAGTLVLAVVSVYWNLRSYLKKNTQRAVLIVVGVLIVSLSPYVIQRYSAMAKALVTQVNKANPGSTGARIEAAETAVSLIVESPIIGVGSGDAQTAILERNKEKGFDILVKYNLNCHNQFLETTVALGFVGLAALLAVFILPFRKALRNKNVLVIAILFVLFLNCLAESWLQRQYGTISTAFVFCLMPYLSSIKRKA